MPLSADYRNAFQTFAIEVVLIGAAWYLFKLNNFFTAILLGGCLLVALTPGRYRNWVSGVGLLALAAFTYLKYGQVYMAAGFAVFGAFALAAAVREARPH